MTFPAAGDTTVVRSLVEQAEAVAPDAELGHVLTRVERGAGAVLVADGEGQVAARVRERDLVAALTRKLG